MGFAVVTHEVHYYPQSGIARLSHSQGGRWAALMEWVTKLPVSDPHAMALTRTLRHLIRTLNLSPTLKHDPFCALCAVTALEAYAGSEQDLITSYHQNLQEINRSIRTMRVREAAAKKASAVA